MCFSAEASFLAAGVTGAAGVTALALSRRAAEWPLATMPLFFAVQQTAEGLLWRELPMRAGQADAALWTNVFLMFALVFWPVYAPLSVLLIEQQAKLRQWMSLVLLAGVVVSLYFLWSLRDHPQTASIGGAHIVYSGDPQAPLFLGVLYALATCGAALLSSHRTVRVLGAILIVGGLIATYAYWHAFTSVWCFFAAVASALIVFQFEVARRQHASETL